MKNTIKKWYGRLAFPSEYDVEFNQLLSTVELREQTVAEYDLKSEDDGKNLLMFLYFCEQLFNDYKKAGIPENVFYDTVSDIVIWTNVYYKAYGKLGLHEIDWLARHMSMRLFRLGRLQFCMADGELEVHIPEGEPMLPEKCRESFDRSKDFFKTYYPNFKYDKMTCHSWLFDENLLPLLKTGSNIEKFRDMFEIGEAQKSDAALRYVFGENADRSNLELYNAKSGFAKRLKQYVLSGGSLYEVLGIINIK